MIIYCHIYICSADQSFIYMSQEEGGGGGSLKYINKICPHIIAINEKMTHLSITHD
jgi:hypothetical protein